MSSAKALEKAIESGDAAAVRSVLAAKPDLVRCRVRKILTPLLLAAYCRQPEIVGILLEHGAELDVCSCAALGRLEELKHLLAEMPSRANSRSPDRLSALHLAARFDRREAVGILLNNGANVNEASNDARLTPLHSAASVPVAELLLAHGADVNAQAGNGGTALLFAAAAGNLEMVRCLLAHGAETDRKTVAGQTAWATAVKMGQREIADLLFHHAGAKRP